MESPVEIRSVEEHTHPSCGNDGVCVCVCSGAVVLQVSCFSEAERIYMLAKDTTVGNKALTSLVIPEIEVKVTMTRPSVVTLRFVFADGCHCLAARHAGRRRPSSAGVRQPEERRPEGQRASLQLPETSEPSSGL